MATLPLPEMATRLPYTADTNQTQIYSGWHATASAAVKLWVHCTLRCLSTHKEVQRCDVTLISTGVTMVQKQEHCLSKHLHHAALRWQTPDT